MRLVKQSKYFLGFEALDPLLLLISYDDEWSSIFVLRISDIVGVDSLHFGKTFLVAKSRFELGVGDCCFRTARID